MSVREHGGIVHRIDLCIQSGEPSYLVNKADYSAIYKILLPGIRTSRSTRYFKVPNLGTAFWTTSWGRVHTIDLGVVIGAEFPPEETTLL